MFSTEEGLCSARILKNRFLSLIRKRFSKPKRMPRERPNVYITHCKGSPVQATEKIKDEIYIALETCLVDPDKHDF